MGWGLTLWHWTAKPRSGRAPSARGAGVMHDAESDARSAPLRCNNKIVHFFLPFSIEDKSPEMHAYLQRDR